MRLSHSQVIALAVGGAIVAAIGTFYTVKTHTIWLQGRPLYCKSFQTKDSTFPGSVELCVIAVTHPYVHENGDVELQLMFQPSPNEQVIVDTVAWVADDIDGQGEYEGEINYERTRVYEHGLLVHDEKKKFSGWHDPIVPEDVLMPMWHWLAGLTPAFDRPRLSIEHRLRNWLDGFLEIGAMGTTATLTIWRVVKGTTIES